MFYDLCSTVPEQTMYWGSSSWAMQASLTSNTMDSAVEPKTRQVALVSKIAATGSGSAWDRRASVVRVMPAQKVRCWRQVRSVMTAWSSRVASIWMTGYQIPYSLLDWGGWWVEDCLSCGLAIPAKNIAKFKTIVKKADACLIWCKPADYSQDSFMHIQIDSNLLGPLVQVCSPKTHTAIR